MKPTELAAKTVYTCPMHPEVVSDTAGVCPKCNMRLEPKPQFHLMEVGALASAAMSLSSVSVLTNSLRLRRFGK